MQGTDESHRSVCCGLDRENKPRMGAGNQKLGFGTGAREKKVEEAIRNGEEDLISTTAGVQIEARVPAPSRPPNPAGTRGLAQ